MLADMAMKLEAARQLTYHAAIQSEQAMNGVKQPSLTFTSSAAKCFASDVAMDVTTDAVQLLGGYGYVKDYPVERMMRDAKITQIYEGTNQIQRMVMARQLLKGKGSRRTPRSCQALRRHAHRHGRTDHAHPRREPGLRRPPRPGCQPLAGAGCSLG